MANQNAESRNDEQDHAQAAREAAARARLLAAGAASLPRPPWLRAQQPPAATDLIRFALWRADTGGTGADAGGIGDEGVLAGLALLAAARAELDQSEAALLFTARASGLSWPRISRAMGLGSPQAAQQRFERVTGRTQNPSGQ